ncbi:MAG: MBOAT family protein [bacterium]|nr:MBOAT family protein [bacterium]
MVFNSVVFALFLAVILVVYWRTPARRRNIILLAGSYVFYGWWDYRFLSLLAISTVVDFYVGKRIYGTVEESRRKRWLLLSVAVNLGILAIFKYSGFFVDSLSALTSSIGFGELSPALRVVLPVGISFYTFQTMSYSFDIFRHRIDPTRSLIDFGTYVAYFPQLVAGPIERASRLLPQIETYERPKPRGDRLVAGIGLIAVGFFKKVVLADGVAGVANAVFAEPAGFSGISTLVGVLAFAIQIYGDFAGYTDIARGVSKLLGIDLVLNFSEPYLARNITEFWRRWHISLSDWLRDYLYIPLGGNRGSTLATYRNLMVTMLLGGLWHGASWNFVLWGGLHGAYLVVHKLTRRGAVDSGPLRWTHAPSIIVTFLFVNVAWVFFRADTFSGAWQVLRNIFTMADGATSLSDLVLVAVLGVATLVVDLGNRVGADAVSLMRRSPALAGAAAAIVIAAVIVFSGGTPEPFIYFQF